jgi:hypothetical protein
VTSPSPVTLLLSMQDKHRRPARRTTPLRVTATPSPATGLLLPWTMTGSASESENAHRKFCSGIGAIAVVWPVAPRVTPRRSA